MSDGEPAGVTALATEEDVVAVRQRTRWVAERLGFDRQDQVRLATAVSEIARNVLVHGGGEVCYAIDSSREIPALVVRVSDRGTAPADWESILDGQMPPASGQPLGLRSARRLVDGLEIARGQGDGEIGDGEIGDGAVVVLRKALPKRSTGGDRNFQAILARIGREQPPNPLTEMRQQHLELLASLEELKRRQDELAQLNTELEDTNRGVVALYAEIEERADALRQANELKSRFLSHMSHEFRTPLNAIIALTRLLLDRSDGELSEEQERQITYIRSAALGLTDLVNDLLDLAKVQAGKAAVEVAPFRVVDLFGALRGMLRPLLGGDTVALIFDPAEDIPTLRTDEAKVSQVLRNFVSNAVKFTEAGEVRVSAEHRPGPDTVVFSVRDTGIGIAAEHQQRIFEEYVQIDSPLQGRVKGTGLGLALSQRLAELLGGKVGLESSPGVGSTFFLEVPRVFEAAEKRAPEDQGRKLHRILVIDDEETSRYIVRRLLKDLPVAVTEAADGQEGLLRAKAERPDLIFLDLRLPVVDGFEVLARLGADPETSDIPVVVITASVIEPDDRRRLQRAAGIFWKDSLSHDSVGGLLAHILAITPGGGSVRRPRADH